MNKANFDDMLASQLTELEKIKQPERDLWPGVELALANDNEVSSDLSLAKRRGNKMYLLVATFAMFGLIGWLSLNSSYQAIDGHDLVAALSQQHQQQKNELLVRFQGQEALAQNWQEQLSELDEAASAIKMALENEPNNMALLKMLQNVHQQQINLIERVHSPKWSQI